MLKTTVLQPTGYYCDECGNAAGVTMLRLHVTLLNKWTISWYDIKRTKIMGDGRVGYMELPCDLLYYQFEELPLDELVKAEKIKIPMDEALQKGYVYIKRDGTKMLRGVDKSIITNASGANLYSNCAPIMGCLLFRGLSSIYLSQRYNLSESSSFPTVYLVSEGGIFVKVTLGKEEKARAISVIPAGYLAEDSDAYAFYKKLISNKQVHKVLINAIRVYGTGACARPLGDGVLFFTPFMYKSCTSTPITSNSSFSVAEAREKLIYATESVQTLAGKDSGILIGRRNRSLNDGNLVQSELTATLDTGKLRGIVNIPAGVECIDATSSTKSTSPIQIIVPSSVWHVYVGAAKDCATPILRLSAPLTAYRIHTHDMPISQWLLPLSAERGKIKGTEVDLCVNDPVYEGQVLDTTKNMIDLHDFRLTAELVNNATFPADKVILPNTPYTRFTAILPPTLSNSKMLIAFKDIQYRHMEKPKSFNANVVIRSISYGNLTQPVEVTISAQGITGKLTANAFWDASIQQDNLLTIKDANTLNKLALSLGISSSCRVYGAGRMLSEVYLDSKEATIFGGYWVNNGVVMVKTRYIEIERKVKLFKCCLNVDYINPRQYSTPCCVFDIKLHKGAARIDLLATLSGCRGNGYGEGILEAFLGMERLLKINITYASGYRIHVPKGTKLALIQASLEYAEELCEGSKTYKNLKYIARNSCLAYNWANKKDMYEKLLKYIIVDDL